MLYLGVPQWPLPHGTLVTFFKGQINTPSNMSNSWVITAEQNSLWIDYHLHFMALTNRKHFSPCLDSIKYSVSCDFELGQLNQVGINFSKISLFGLWLSTGKRSWGMEGKCEIAVISMFSASV